MKFIENPKTILSYERETLLGSFYKIETPDGDINIIGKENAILCLCEMLLGVADLSDSQRKKYSYLNRYQRALLICNNEREINTIKHNLLYVYTELAKKDDELAELLYEHYEKFDDAAHTEYSKLKAVN
tara:strand:- start:490 stop:876 length:387 start_codon:yes stop_codon:yes gene_type:complete